MVAVVNHLHLDIPVEEMGASMENEGADIIASQPGFRGFYFVKAGEKHGIVILLWDTPADAQNASAVFGPTWFAKNVAPHLTQEQGRSVGPVLSLREP